LDQIRSALERKPEFEARCAEYLARFGDRCLDELKLESPTLHDNPLPLFRSIGRLADAEHAADNQHRGGCQRRSLAETKAAAALRGHPIRRMVFRWVLRHARARVRDRENLRFARTRVFGRVRRVFSELGRRLHALGRLDSASDVFYLEVSELFGVIDGTATTADLKSLVAARKNEFELYRDSEPPPSRFQSRGLAVETAASQLPTTEPTDKSDIRRGLGCSPGIVRGRVRVVTDPREVVLERGDIVVAERTDPGWILIFPLAAGLVVERGSLLSHSAIVARELGLPAIVSLEGVTRWLRNGDRIEMDGSSGFVRKLDRDERPIAPVAETFDPYRIATSQALL
jgi:pyruvate,water dikinase